MAKESPEAISPQLRGQITRVLAWGLAIGSFVVPLGLLFAPLVLGLWRLHRRTGRVPVTLVYVALVALAYNAWIAFKFVMMSQ